MRSQELSRGECVLCATDCGLWDVVDGGDGSFTMNQAN